MGDREVVGRQVGVFRIRVDVGSVGVADDLAVTVIFHHDHKRVIEVRDAVWYRALLGESRANERDEQAQS